MLERRKLLGLARLGSMNFGCPRERRFHSHCIPVVFLLLSSCASAEVDSDYIMYTSIAYNSKNIDKWKIRQRSRKPNLHARSCVCVYIPFKKSLLCVS